MESSTYPVNPYSPRRLSGYFDAFVQNTRGFSDPKDWNPTWIQLQNQKKYLEELLSKTVVTLNSLREKQSRNERALINTPSPRSRKKKILQSRWRTDKTIKTCENEERVIFDCLQVCQRNIHTLEAILNPGDSSGQSAVPDHTSTRSSISYDTPLTTELDWSGWTDDQPESPFQKRAQGRTVVDEIPPEMTIVRDMHLAPLEPLDTFPELEAEDVPPVPPNTALPSTRPSHAILSPEAACFEPRIVQYVSEEDPVTKLDKLTISGLLAPRSLLWVPKRRFSDDAVKYLFRVLSDDNLQRWGSDSSTERGRTSHHGSVDSDSSTRKRHNSC